MASKRLYRLMDGCGEHLDRRPGHPVRMLQAGDTIEAFPTEMNGLLHKFEELTPENAAGRCLSILPRGNGRFDLVDPKNGRPISAAPMGKAEIGEAIESWYAANGVPAEVRPAAVPAAWSQSSGKK